MLFGLVGTGRPQLSGATNSPGEDASFVDVELTIACSELPRLTHTNVRALSRLKGAEGGG